MDIAGVIKVETRNAHDSVDDQLASQNRFGPGQIPWNPGTVQPAGASPRSRHSVCVWHA